MLKVGSLFVLFTQLLFCVVFTSVDNKNITIGDSVTFTITTQGSDNVEFPSINKIGNYKVLSTSSQTQTFFVNGRYSKKISKSFTFAPTQSMTIPSFSVKQNKKVFKTQKIKITVSKNKSINQGGEFELEATIQKNTLYEFEHVILKLIFKRNVRSNVSDLKLSMPSMSNFWKKQIGKEKAYKKGNEVHYELTYLISPQKSGKLTIPPIGIDVGKEVRTRDFFGLLRNSTQYKRYFSNSIPIDVKKLPDGVSIIGDFDIKAIVDKTTTNSNEPVNLTIKIEGKGNFEDIPSFDIKLPNVSVYANEPKTFTDINNGSFEQKLAFIAGTSYTIEPIKLSFFSLKENKVKTIQTLPINIKVNPLLNQAKSIISVSKTPLKSTNNKKSDKNYLDYVYSFTLGFILAFIISFLLFRDSKLSFENCICTKLIRKLFGVFKSYVAFDDKKALNILLSIDEQTPQIKDFINALENKLYKNKDEQIDYKSLRALIKSLESNNNFTDKRV